MGEDPGVLGNLPRSRPGRRSAKRHGSTAPAGPAPASPKRQPRRSASAAKASSPARAGRREQRPAVRPERAPGPPNPAETAIHLAGVIVGAGLRTAAGILRRLPG